MSDRENGRERQPDAQRRPPGGGPGGGGPGRGMPMMGEKPRDFKKSWSRLARYGGRYAPVFIVAVLCAFGGTVLTLIGPDMIKDVTGVILDGLLTGIDTAAVMDKCLKLLAIYVVGSALVFVQSRIMASVSQGICRRLRSDISSKLNKLPLRYFDSTTHGNTISRVTNDTDTIGMTLNQSLGQLITSVTMFAGSIVMMFIEDVTLAAIAVASTLIGFVFMFTIIRRSQKYFRSNQKYLGAMNGHIEEIYTGHNIVKAYNAERAAREKFDELNKKLSDSNWKSQFLSGLMMPLMGFIGNFGYVAVCVAGALLAMNGSIRFEVIIAFILYVRLFTQPLAQIAQTATTMQSTAAASERVFELLDEEEMAPDAPVTEKIDETRGSVRFERVRFGYEPDRVIIKDFNAHIEAGQKVAIVGPTGAGKTTIVNLLMRFYELDGGVITVDGVPTSKMARRDVHDLFCMVLQDTWLFEGTIMENIVYSKRGVTEEQVVAACRAVGLDHFIRTLPGGYSTELGDNASLSAGQRQLVTIARAMIEDAPLLILDEATSSVDTRTEILVQNAMDKLTEGRTSFVIAHRLSTIRNADVILVMRDGDIVESGSHARLMELGGFYAQLYNSQFENS
ncbi:MAG: ABC transporter ATP-binding protein/permease [Oscillospiraceae bacterium]|nr:ABC transporter ATP-binding protein/permease [Oscillospiraceae bacterium]